MAFTEQEKEAALKLYDELGSVGQVINKLGYPSRQNMYTWIKNRDIEKKRNKYDCSDEPDHRRHPSLDSKLEILHRCFEIGEDIKSLSEETGYSRNSIYHWRKLYLAGGAGALMSKKNHLPRGKLEVKSDSEMDNDTSELAARIKDLELENDILKQTIEILKKDQGIDILKLKNKEKTMIIDALRNKYSLSLLLKKLNISKSSYCYQHNAMTIPDKYEKIGNRISELFHENKERYGYRRINALLRKEEIKVSEKIVRMIMKKNKLSVKTRKAKKYNSYQRFVKKTV